MGCVISKAANEAIPLDNKEKKTIGPKAEHHSIIIVGGGVAGLHTALRLHEAGKSDIKLFEGRSMLGGRVKTTRDEDGKPKFNDFAWRVGEGNEKMLALCKEFDIKLREQFTPASAHKGSHSDSSADAGHDASHPTPPGRAPLSAYASHCLESTNGADDMDRKTGYAGRSAQISFPGESHGTVNFVVEEGMNHIPTTLASKLPEGMVNTNHRVKDVTKLADGKYQCDIVVRKGNDYTPLTFTCDTLVLAAPPVSLRQLTIAREGLNPVLFAVHQRRLMHCYVKSKSENVPDRSDTEDRIYQGFPDSILQQVVSGDYGGGIFQGAYACDRFERVWRELTFQGPEVVKAELEKQLARIDLPAIKGVSIDEVQISSGFVHRWHIEAHLNGKTKEDLQEQAVYPQPVRLPRLHLVGEAFSSQQGWTEGALLTSLSAVDYILNDKTTSKSKFAQPLPLPEPTKGGANMIYRGIVADVSEWGSRHPGGFGPIMGHGNEVVDEIFDNFHNGWPAPLATMFGLQTGVLEK